MGAQPKMMALHPRHAGWFTLTARTRMGGHSQSADIEHGEAL